MANNSERRCTSYRAEVASHTHFHHCREELLVVLRGTLTLRTPTGEHQIDEGEVVHFRAGPAGAHGITKQDEAVRYIMISTLDPDDTSEYPSTL